MKNDFEKYSPRVQGGKYLPTVKSLLDRSFFVHENRDVKDVYLNYGGSFIKLNITKRDTLEVDTIIANNLYAKTFTLRQTSFQNGDLMVGNAGGVVDSVDGNEITFKDQSGFNVCAFADGDLIEAYSVRADNSLEITHPQGTVTQVIGNKVTITYYGTAHFQKGDEVYSVGNTTDATRKDSLYFTTNRANSPYFAVYDNINSFDTSGSPATAWGSATPVVLIGNGKSLSAGYTHGVYIGAGGQLIISPSATVSGVVTHAPVYTSGASLPGSPATTDWHFWTGTQQTIGGVVFYPNTWYKYSGSAWDNQGLLGTHIDGNGIYTGTVVAAQVIAGTLTGFTIQTGTSGKRIKMETTGVLTFYDPSGISSYISGGSSSFEVTSMGKMTISAGSGATDNLWLITGGILSISAAGGVLGITYSDVGAAASGHNHSGVYLPVSGAGDIYTHNASEFVTGTPWTSMGYLTVETDPNVYAWAKAATKPSYTYSEVGAAASGHNHSGTYLPVSGAGDIYTHNASEFSVSSHTHSGLYLEGNGFVSGDLETNIGGYIQINTTNWGDKSWVGSQGYLTSASSLDPSKVSQTSSYRFVTDTEKSTWNGKTVVSLGASDAGTFSGTVTMAQLIINGAGTGYYVLVPN